ncbi:ATP-grasp peptide maturase system methyltransferase [Streptomyces sp. CA-210063]|uniref:ATP-grasp peptide maturase system methyltransferase n=1 Tax=Streptomyces sp. CA-210063 TaxID=2801029 RepID=UPI00214B3D88|nr:ATP-grasp peptide maturase system methyltransferase [Streptomyces sp. CA-210063]UUU33642.1 ATP-grasp peptide maturase system methyltransferase [Streptomyces sp. CA-210063]
MSLPDSAPQRQALADRLKAAGVLKDPKWRAAVEAVPRELFLTPGVFLPAEGGRWNPVTALGAEPKEWLEIAYSDNSLATQLDGHLTSDQTADPVTGVPTSSSTTPMTVVGMIEDLEVGDDHTVLEVGTGTGYSTALLCHRLGEDNVTTIEVDPQVAARADAALEETGFSTWAVTGDGLLGHPRRAPYDRVIATCAVRRIPYAWVRQTKPGGIILATVGSWTYGTGLAKVIVNEDGTAEGRIIGRSSFMHARAQAPTPLAGDLSARTAYPDTERQAKLPPTLLQEWMPAFLAQLAAPGAQFVRATGSDGAQLLYLFDAERESFAAFTEDASGWTVRQGGPVALWDDVEQGLVAWADADQPDISTVRLHITDAAHTYWIGGQKISTKRRSHWIGEKHMLRWEHRLTKPRSDL